MTQKALDRLAQRMDGFDQKFNDIERRLAELESKQIESVICQENTDEDTWRPAE